MSAVREGANYLEVRGEQKKYTIQPTQVVFVLEIYSRCVVCTKRIISSAHTHKLTHIFMRGGDSVCTCKFHLI